MSSSNNLAEYWYHGTRSQARWTEWVIPPPVTLDLGIGGHTAVFFALEPYWASKSGQGTMCRVRLTLKARVLDLRTDSVDSDALRKHLLSIEHGKPWRHTMQLQTQERWRTGCVNGDALRFQPAGFQREKLSKLHGRAMKAIQEREAGRQVQPSDYEAVVQIQNLTRSWIEAICAGAKGLGYTVLAAREPDNTGSERPHDILAVFEPQSLTPPEWIG